MLFNNAYVIFVAWCHVLLSRRERGASILSLSFLPHLATPFSSALLSALQETEDLIRSRHCSSVILVSFWASITLAPCVIFWCSLLVPTLCSVCVHMWYGNQCMEPDAKLSRWLCVALKNRSVREALAFFQKCNHPPLLSAYQVRSAVRGDCSDWHLTALTSDYLNWKKKGSLKLLLLCNSKLQQQRHNLYIVLLLDWWSDQHRVDPIPPPPPFKFSFSLWCKIPAINNHHK